MEGFLQAVESQAPALRALAAKHLADLKPERPQKEASVSEGSGILWGWKEVSDYMRIGEDKTRALAKDPDVSLACVS